MKRNKPAMHSDPNTWKQNQYNIESFSISHSESKATHAIFFEQEKFSLVLCCAAAAAAASIRF